MKRDDLRRIAHELFLDNPGAYGLGLLVKHSAQPAFRLLVLTGMGRGMKDVSRLEDLAWYWVDLDGPRPAEPVANSDLKKLGEALQELELGSENGTGDMVFSFSKG